MTSALYTSNPKIPTANPVPFALPANYEAALSEFNTLIAKAEQGDPSISASAVIALDDTVKSLSLVITSESEQGLPVNTTITLDAESGVISSKEITSLSSSEISPWESRSTSSVTQSSITPEGVEKSQSYKSEMHTSQFSNERDTTEIRQFAEGGLEQYQSQSITDPVTNLTSEQSSTLGVSESGSATLKSEESQYTSAAAPNGVAVTIQHEKSETNTDTIQLTPSEIDLIKDSVNSFFQEVIVEQTGQEATASAEMDMGGSE